MDFVSTMRNIEATENQQKLEDILKSIESTEFSIEQYNILKCFAQLRLSYSILKFNQINSIERDVIARALDELRNYEHEL